MYVNQSAKLKVIRKGKDTLFFNYFFFNFIFGIRYHENIQPNLWNKTDWKCKDYKCNTNPTNIQFMQKTVYFLTLQISLIFSSMFLLLQIEILKIP